VGCDAESESIEELELKVNHRSGMSYSDLKEAYEEQKAKAEEFGHLLNQARLLINNPFHRRGAYIEAAKLGAALKMEQVWQPKK